MTHEVMYNPELRDYVMKRIHKDYELERYKIAYNVGMRILQDNTFMERKSCFQMKGRHSIGQSIRLRTHFRILQISY